MNEFPSYFFQRICAHRRPAGEHFLGRRQRRHGAPLHLRQQRRKRPDRGLHHPQRRDGRRGGRQQHFRQRGRRVRCKQLNRVSGRLRRRQLPRRRGRGPLAQHRPEDGQYILLLIILLVLSISLPHFYYVFFCKSYMKIKFINCYLLFLQ